MKNQAVLLLKLDADKFDIKNEELAQEESQHNNSDRINFEEEILRAYQIKETVDLIKTEPENTPEKSCLNDTESQQDPLAESNTIANDLDLQSVTVVEATPTTQESPNTAKIDDTITLTVPTKSSLNDTESQKDLLVQSNTTANDMELQSLRPAVDATATTQESPNASKIDNTIITVPVPATEIKTEKEWDLPLTSQNRCISPEAKSSSCEPNDFDEADTSMEGNVSFDDYEDFEENLMKNIKKSLVSTAENINKSEPKEQSLGLDNRNHFACLRNIGTPSKSVDEASNDLTKPNVSNFENNQNEPRKKIQKISQSVSTQNKEEDKDSSSSDSQNEHSSLVFRSISPQIMDFIENLERKFDASKPPKKIKRSYSRHSTATCTVESKQQAKKLQVFFKNEPLNNLYPPMESKPVPVPCSKTPQKANKASITPKNSTNNRLPTIKGTKCLRSQANKKPYSLRTLQKTPENAR